MNEELNENADIYTLVDEDGVEQLFELVDEYEENGNVYYALIPYFDDPADSLDGDAELVVLKLESSENGEEILSTIDDDDEYEHIGNIFMERIQTAYDGEEDEE